LQQELTELYILVTRLAIVCKQRNIPLIIENPYSQQHYLRQRWCLRPDIIDYDRTKNGDYYKKPTQYWFLNCKPKQNVFFEPLYQIETSLIVEVTKNRPVVRSMIHPQYASRFIRMYVIDDEVDINGKVHRKEKLKDGH